MKLITAYRLSEEVREIGVHPITAGKPILFVRDRNLYKPFLERAKNTIEDRFANFGKINFDDASLIEVNSPRISRMQGIFYLPRDEKEEEGIYYLNTGINNSEYKIGERNLSLVDEYVLNRRLSDREKIKIVGKHDKLIFNLGNKESFEFSIFNENY